MRHRLYGFRHAVPGDASAVHNTRHSFLDYLECQFQQLDARRACQVAFIN